jgi:hypothetical protein
MTARSTMMVQAMVLVAALVLGPSQIAAAGDPDEAQIKHPEAASSQAKQEETGVSLKKDEKKQPSKGKAVAYHRVDFMATGTDCPICLTRVGTKMRNVPGVMKALVWPWVPHYGVAIYDAEQTNWGAILESTRDETVIFQDVKDLAISPEEFRMFLEGKRSLTPGSSP